MLELARRRTRADSWYALYLRELNTQVGDRADSGLRGCAGLNQARGALRPQPTAYRQCRLSAAARPSACRRPDENSTAFLGLHRHYGAEPSTRPRPSRAPAGCAGNNWAARSSRRSLPDANSTQPHGSSNPLRRATPVALPRGLHRWARSMRRAAVARCRHESALTPSPQTPGPVFGRHRPAERPQPRCAYDAAFDLLPAYSRYFRPTPAMLTVSLFIRAAWR